MEPIHDPVDYNHKLTFMKNFSIDYVVNEMTREKLCEKYQITRLVYDTYLNRYKLREKREKYKRDMLDRALSKMAEKQSMAIAKSVKILLRQLDAIEKVQNYMDSLPEDENDRLKSRLSKLLPSEIVNDVMKMFMVMVKDNKLNPAQAGEGVVTKVIVEMNSSIPTFSKDITHAVPNMVEAQVVESEQKLSPEPEPAKEEEIVVESDIPSVL